MISLDNYTSTIQDLLYMFFLGNIIYPFGSLNDYVTITDEEIRFVQ